MHSSHAVPVAAPRTNRALAVPIVAVSRRLALRPTAMQMVWPLYFGPFYNTFLFFILSLSRSIDQFFSVLAFFIFFCPINKKKKRNKKTTTTTLSAVYEISASLVVF